MTMTHCPHCHKRLSELTQRETEIIRRIATGMTVKDIATEFNLSTKTVDTHRFNLMRKLNLHNRAEVVHYAIINKLVRPMFDEDKEHHFRLSA
jgi:two-component system response regulator NreC